MLLFHIIYKFIPWLLVEDILNLLFSFLDAEPTIIRCYRSNKTFDLANPFRQIHTNRKRGLQKVQKNDRCKVVAWNRK